MEIPLPDLHSVTYGTYLRDATLESTTKSDENLLIPEYYYENRRIGVGSVVRKQSDGEPSGVPEFSSCKMANHMLAKFNWAIFVNQEEKWKRKGGVDVRGNDERAFGGRGPLWP